MSCGFRVDAADIAVPDVEGHVVAAGHMDRANRVCFGDFTLAKEGP